MRVAIIRRYPEKQRCQPVGHATIPRTPHDSLGKGLDADESVVANSPRPRREWWLPHIDPAARTIRRRSVLLLASVVVAERVVGQLRFGRA